MADITTAPVLFVVIGFGEWGEGQTLAEAKKNFRRQGASLSDGYAILDFTAEDSEFVDVDGLGRVSYNGPAPVVTQVKATRR
jgi:hypothetical protein